MRTELKLLFKPLLLTSLLALGFASLHFQWWGSFTELDLLNRLFEQHWAIAWPVFFIVGIVYTALGGPRQVLAFACGYLMGGLPGALLSTLLTGFGELMISMVKAALFGLFAGMVGCYQGLNVKGGAKGVGDAVNETVVYSFMALFVVNVVVTAVGLKATAG